MGSLGPAGSPFVEGSFLLCMPGQKEGHRQEKSFVSLRLFLMASGAGLGPGTHLFAGSLVSVHLHHALAEDVKRVFFLLRPVSPQALSF